MKIRSISWKILMCTSLNELVKYLTAQINRYSSRRRNISELFSLESAAWQMRLFCQISTCFWVPLWCVKSWFINSSKIFWGFYLLYGHENTLISSAFLIRVKGLSWTPFIVNKWGQYQKKPILIKASLQKDMRSFLLLLW